MASKGRFEEARASLSKIRQLPLNDPQIDEEMQSIQGFLKDKETAPWKDLFLKRNLKRLAVGVPLILFQNFVVKI